MNKKKSVDLSRREFLKGSLVVGGSGIVLSVAGCAPKVAQIETTSAAPAAEGVT